MAWLHPHDRSWGEQHFRLALVQRLLLIIPFAAIQEQAVGVHAILWLGGEVLMPLLHHVHIKSHVINGNSVLTRKVLKGGGQEGLW